MHRVSQQKAAKGECYWHISTRQGKTSVCCCFLGFEAANEPATVKTTSPGQTVNIFDLQFLDMQKEKLRIFDNLGCSFRNVQVALIFRKAESSEALSNLILVVCHHMRKKIGNDIDIFFLLNKISHHYMQ